MAQPPSYNRQKNFADDFGNETDHSALNAELDRASNSINDIRTNLAILQADDGKLRPSVVTADSISTELRTTLVEGVVMDAQAMLDRSLAAADASSASARVAKASEEKALESSSRALIAAEEAEESAKSLALVTNPDWNATEGRAQILNRPELSAVAISGQYKDLDGKPGNLATTEDIAVLQEEIARKVEGVPVGTIEYFAMSAPPPGYLMADGTAVGRETYPDLFAAIGTVFGEGDGVTTFNLPDLIGRFAQGSATPGQKVKAGLPNITGDVAPTSYYSGVVANGAFYGTERTGNTVTLSNAAGPVSVIGLDASRSNPVYGASDTVQPPALTLLPCIKAFDAATNPGLIDITELAQEIANKTDKSTAAHAAMPSNKIQLSLSANPQTFTAIADGYFNCTAYAGTAAGFINFSNSNGLGSMVQTTAGGASKVFLPVKKGDVLAVNYSNLSSADMSFHCCEGSQP